MRLPERHPELSLLPSGGGTYEVGGADAIWEPRPGSPNIIDLSFRGKHFELSKEGAGPKGRPRYLVTNTRKPDGKILHARSIVELVRQLDLYFDHLVDLIDERIAKRLEESEERIGKRIEARVDRLEKGLG